MSTTERRSDLERMLEVSGTLASKPDVFEKLVIAFDARDVGGFRAALGEWDWGRPFETVCIDIVTFVCVWQRELVCRRRKGLRGLVCSWTSTRTCKWWSKTLCFQSGPGFVDPPFRPTG